MAELQTVCLDMLGQGAVQSFVDLMYLACDARTPRSVLPAVREALVSAELARRHGETATVIHQYSQIADMFASCGVMKTSVYFLERALEIATSSGNDEARMDMCRLLGGSYETMGDSVKAVSYHQAHQELAIKLDDASQRASASSQLVRVYAQQAAEAEASKNLEDALRLYLAAAAAAQDGSDPKAQANSQYNAGRLYVLLGRPDEAVPLLQAYVSSATTMAPCQTSTHWCMI